MRTLIITSCTGEKRHKPDNQLFKQDFLNIEDLPQKEQELKEYREKASDLYTGMQHLRLMEGINDLRNHFNRNIVDLSIISAGYGLIHEDRMIVPYEVTFNEMNNNEIIEWSNHLQIPQNVNQLIKNYDLVFFLLGEKYLRSLQLPFDSVNEEQKLIFLASKTSEKLIPTRKQYCFLEVGQNDAKEFSYGLVGLKGYLFKLLSTEIISHGESLIDEIYANPDIVMQKLEKYRKKEQLVEQLTLFPKQKVKEMKELGAKKTKVKKKQDNQLQQKELQLSSEQFAKNYGVHKLKFFMPENDDRVDPNFNFITEEHTKERDPQKDDYYAHQFFNLPNYDGVLISKINIDKSKHRKDQILEAGGLHKFLRLPGYVPLYGDCGAFSYIQQEIPSSNTDEILEYYKEMGFNIGTSIDHLIVGKIAEDKEKRQFRYDLTLRNAKDFIKKHREGNYQFVPSGVAQGWDPYSYKKAVNELINMGYQHISLGGLAKAKSEEILEILLAIAPIIPEYLEVHLLGAARLDYLDVYHKLGVTSFDSTTFLKKAWGGATGGNYFTQDRNKYAAIRIPQADAKKNPRIKELVARKVNTINEFNRLEQKSLRSIREYDHGTGNIDIDTVVETVLEYDSYFETLKVYKEEYKKVKAIKDEYIIEKLNLSEKKLGEIEKGIFSLLQALNKSIKINGFEEFRIHELSFHAFIAKIEGLLKNSKLEMFKSISTIATRQLKRALNAQLKANDKAKAKEIEIDLKAEAAIRDEAELEKIISLNKFLIGDLSFKSIICESGIFSQEYVGDVVFNQMKKIALTEVEAIKEKNLTLFDTPLKEFFSDNYNRVYTGNNLRPLYHQVLTDQPWKKCDCAICKDVGVEVIIFRGNNRNRRRGFHNTYVFYNQLKEIIK
jgi:hypothetical protein